LCVEIIKSEAGNTRFKNLPVFLNFNLLKFLLTDFPPRPHSSMLTPPLEKNEGIQPSKVNFNEKINKRKMASQI
jgi:hypothetical protein